MTRLQLYRLLRQHIVLSEKRSVAFEQNKVAKFIMYLMSSFVIIYMMFISVGLALIANTSDSYTQCEFFFGLLPFFLVADFFFRFLGQQTPAQLIKPYLLLPIGKYACVECFIISSILTPNNLIWLTMTIPYVIMTTLFSEGLLVSLGVVLVFQLLVIINSQWYMLVRTLINHSILYWLLPAAVYAVGFMPWIVNKFDTFFDIYSYSGSACAHFNPIALLIVFAVLGAFFLVNRRVQYIFTYNESVGAEKENIKTVSSFSFLERFGEQGEYLKLEVKSIFRNKNMRKSFIFGTCFVLILSLLISFTDLYQDEFSKKFWIVYNFVLYGAMLLVKIMSAEGNYIDGLMVHKENIVSLLKAKYFFYSALLLFPFLLMLPTVFMGKYTILSLLSMMIFTAGPVYFLLMQMAIYNRQTIPLNSKFVSKGNIETNYFQIVVELVVMFVPVILISVLMAIFDETIAYICLMVIGLGFIFTYKIWIRNIYDRFMQRRYKNMESFRATR